MTNIKKRRNKLLNILKEDEDIDISELSKKVGASIPTIYRDLRYFDQEGLFNKVINKYELLDLNDKNHDFFNRLNINSDLKKIISQEAVKLIDDNDVIAIDASSTCFYLCKELKKLNLNLTIITNSIFIPVELYNKPNYKIICLGGLLDRETSSFVKSPITELLKNIYIKKFFLSSVSVSPNLGILDDYGMDDIEVRKFLFNLSNENILLVDSNKFLVKGTYNWTGFDKIKNIITDENLDEKIASILKMKDINIVLAKKKNNK